MTINRTSVNFGIVEGEFGLNQCFGRIIWSDPDPDPYQEALIWIRVAPKDYSGKKSIFFKIFNFFVTFRPVSEYIINIVYKL